MDIRSDMVHPASITPGMANARSAALFEPRAANSKLSAKSGGNGGCTTLSDLDVVARMRSNRNWRCAAMVSWTRVKLIVGWTRLLRARWIALCGLGGGGCFWHWFPPRQRSYEWPQLARIGILDPLPHPFTFPTCLWMLIVVRCSWVACFSI